MHAARARRVARASPSRRTRSRPCVRCAMPPWWSASFRLLYASVRSTYFPTIAICTVRSGLRTACTTRSQAPRRGSPVQMPSTRVIFSSRPSSWNDERHLVDVLDVARAVTTASSSTLQNSAILAFTERGRSRSVRQSSTSGAMPTRLELLHRVLERLRLELAHRGDEGHQREVHVADVVAPDVGAELADRLEEGQRLDVADRAAHLEIRMSASSAALWMRSLISSVTCGITCTVPPR